LDLRQLLYLEKARQIILMTPVPRVGEHDNLFPQHVFIPLLRPSRPEDPTSELDSLRYFYDIGILVLRPEAPPGGDVQRWPEDNGSIVVQIYTYSHLPPSVD